LAEGVCSMNRSVTRVFDLSPAHALPNQAPTVFIPANGLVSRQLSEPKELG